jgi:SAM-dependent methyltransferase
MTLPTFVCPRCRGQLRSTSEAYHCAPCAATYPIVAGIPDFRVHPDPWIALEEDRAKALRVDRETQGMDFESSVRAYWAITPETPRELAERYVQHVVGASQRSREWLTTLDDVAPGTWLDAGCGTGDLLAAGVRLGVPMVGCDIALRWLVVARRRPELRDRKIPLVCCCAEALPFENAAFNRVAALGLVEHTADARVVCRETRRVLASGGRFDLRTVNRFSLLPEPHVRVWGVGFLPRSLADGYVRWRSGMHYRHHRPLSARELSLALASAGFTRVRVGAATVLDQEQASLGRVGQWFVPLYAALRRIPVARSLLAGVAPLLEASATAP